MSIIRPDDGRRDVVYFPDGGEVTLDISNVKGGMKVKWLDITQSKWETQQTLEAGRDVALRAPQSGPWVVLVSKMRAGSNVFIQRPRRTTARSSTKR